MRQAVTVERLGGKSAEPFGVAFRDAEMVVSDGQAGELIFLDPGKGERRSIKGFDTPSGVVVRKDGSILVAETGSNTIRMIADNGGTIFDFAGSRNKRGFADGDSRSALFNGPTGLAHGDDGRLFVADTYNDRIRVIENGTVRTIAGGKRGFADGVGTAAMFDTPIGIAAWGERLLVADSGNRRIRVVEQDGTVWTLAGSGYGDLKDGLPLSASFVRPTAVAVSGDGAIYVADGNAIRSIGRNALPFVETIAGGSRGYRDGVGKTAKFNRPSGIAFSKRGELFVADSDNGLVRQLISSDSKAVPAFTADTFTPEEFRELAPARWPYDPPDAKRDIAGTLAEIRGEMLPDSDQVWFHNGLDIAGGYGETARFIRSETVLDPLAAEFFATSRELLRMPTLGYIHIRLGRDSNDAAFGDDRFLFDRDDSGKITGVRVPRGAKFAAGEPIGTLNAMNHVHLIAGRPGAEMNALAALILPGVSDSRPPVIESVELFGENWEPFETPAGGGRITLNGKVRVVAAAFDQKDGNPERRKLGIYRAGYEVLTSGGQPVFDAVWTLNFLRFPPNDAVRFAYANGSRSGATGETRFRYIVTNFVNGDEFREGFLDISTLANGIYTLRVNAADFFGNITTKDIQFEVKR